MNTPFIPISPSQAALNNSSSDMNTSLTTPGSSYSDKSTTRFSFAGAANNSFVNGSPQKQARDDAAEYDDEEDKNQPNDSDKADSQTSEQILNQVREQFKKKEVSFKHRIAQLTQKI